MVTVCTKGVAHRGTTRTEILSNSFQDTVEVLICIRLFYAKQDLLLIYWPSFERSDISCMRFLRFTEKGKLRKPVEKFPESLTADNLCRHMLLVGLICGALARNLPYTTYSIECTHVHINLAVVSASK